MYRSVNIICILKFTTSTLKFCFTFPDKIDARSEVPYAYESPGLLMQIRQTNTRSWQIKTSMRRFFCRRRTKAPTRSTDGGPSSEVGELSSDSTSASRGPPPTLVLHMPDMDDVGSMNGSGGLLVDTFAGQFVDLDQLLAIIGEEEQSLAESRRQESVGPDTSYGDRSLLGLVGRSEMPDTNESVVTVPIRNILGKNDHGLLTSLST